MLPRASHSRAKTIVLHPADTSYTFNEPIKLSELCRWDCWSDDWLLPSYHVVAVELLHDRGLVQKLNPFSHTGRFVDRLDGHSRLGFVLDHALGDALVHHAEGALAQLLVHRDLFPGHLPLVRNVH